jgi:putative redox protein
MDIQISFPGGKRVDAQLGAHLIQTDQPVAGGGQDGAPAPYDLFLASMGTCAGIYVLGFLQARGLPTAGLGLLQRVEKDPTTGLPSHISFEITLPPGVPEKYRPAVVRAAEQCKVKKTLEAPPEMVVRLSGEPAPEAAHV